MKKNLKLLLLLLLTTCFILSGCGNDKKPTITVYNWGDYIDKSVLKDFEKEHDIRVIYEEYATNEDMYVKLKAGGGDYDVIFPSDYMIKRLIDEDMLHKIDLNKVPNYKNIEDRFKNLGYDPNNEYSVPYMWGTVGIMYNKTMVNEPVDSWRILWDDKYKKQILMQYSQRDAIGITLKMLGYSLNTKNTAELEEAKDMLIKQKPLVLAYVVDEVKDKMIGNEAALAVIWSGEAPNMIEQNPDLEYVIPKEGTNLWFDAMAIPKSSQHKEEAELFINYLCEAEAAFKNSDYIGYATPNSEARKMLPKEITSNKLFYPEPDDLDNSEVFVDLADSLAEYDRIWTEVQAK
ncbi:spermidine/putrescine transport system substrate-binding protein [Desulfonispora thiosulfatigenes DSM 11270]|uniref:Spermidine/putrescine transport system substrate-binding protein n=1 Tax=Desulfonispora thiosulfatigenes DSM 11270 TaxID=656914 RepID=A0A1W1VAX4_DESTI|nr:spermidine/putrescine ABC transporter substrate-binding protein [Desulfonispora thiosulfatigenes]SMB90508.1 spermidine/putrescine transport system substrate-binding protein [Desulfonispora thiosulfatigenes DSM 11270]